jgi:phytoene dehydrogenase-like protein
MWREVGALSDEVKIVNHDFFMSLDYNGEMVTLYNDPKKLESHLLELSPPDADAIRYFCKSIEKLRMASFDLSKPMEALNALDYAAMMAKMLPTMAYFKEYSSITVDQLAQRFVHPAIRAVIRSTMPQSSTAFAFMSTLASLANGDSGWPLGGSKAFAQRMEQRYLALKGTVHYRSKIERIIEENGCATGVELADGRIKKADYIISAADGYDTLYRLLGGRHVSDKQKALYSDSKKYNVITSVTVSLGIRCDLSARDHALVFRLEEGLDAGGCRLQDIPLRHFCYDKTLNEAGKSVICSVLYADYGWWKEKHGDPEAYKHEKQRIGEAIKALVEKRYPETEGFIEVIDVATPVTYERFCNAWKGSWMSWMKTLENDVQFLDGKVPNLKRFEQTGQWTMPPGGLPTAVATGCWSIQRICKAEGKKFTTK